MPRKQVFGYHYGKCGSKTTSYHFMSSQINVSVWNSFICVFSLWLQLKYRCGHSIRVTCRDAFGTLLSIVNVSHRKQKLTLLWYEVSFELFSFKDTWYVSEQYGINNAIAAMESQTIQTYISRECNQNNIRKINTHWDLAIHWYKQVRYF